MKTITTEELSSRYVQNINFLTYLATVLATLITMCSFFWMLFRVGDAATNVLILKCVFLSVVILSAFWAFTTAHRAGHSLVQLDAHYQTAWVLIGLGLLSNILGHSYTSLLPPLIPTAPLSTPGWGVITALFYPLIFFGLLVMPGNGRLRVSTIFDVLITVLCIIGIGWFSITNFSPIASLHGDALAARLLDSGLTLFYPSGDIFLALILAQLIQSGVEPAVRTSYILLVAGLLCIIWADLAGSYMHIFTAGYQVGTPYIDPFSLAGFLLIGLAALHQYSALVRRTYKERLLNSLHRTSITPPENTFYRPEQSSWQRWWHVQSFYIPLALILCILIFLHALTAKESTEGFMILSAISGGLIIVRHLFATHESRTSQQEREKRYSEAEHVRYLAVQLSDIRDLEQLRSRIVNIMLSEFGFTFAMLLLLEEYEGPLSSQSHLQVDAASISANTARWRLHGDNILYRTVSAGKDMVVEWELYQNETPSEIRNWLERQHIPPMLFFPLRYQNKILGSLGVARHALARRHQSELSIVRVYAEQISAVIEHSYLYREAREREVFARAMANISTRLNAAIVEPIEISQQICEEGANALRADYAILYSAHDDGQLVPLAVSISNDASASNPAEWPALPIAEYEAETFHTRHPFLLDITQRRKAPTQTNPSGMLLAIAQDHTHRRSMALRTKLARHYIQTSILAPLVSGGQMIGLLIFARVTPPGASSDLCFDASDLPHAQDFVEQAGVAFANARLYQHLRHTHERLQELDQLKDQFMVTASHELRTPLTAVQGYIELIAQYDEILPPDQRREFLHKAQLGCEELAVLLRNVMDASRLEVEAGIRSALISRVSVTGLIEKVKMMIEPQMSQQKREIQVTIPAQLCVMADPLRLHQVLMNVSTNALKYSPEGTPIAFSARALTDQPSLQVIISVTDKGKGIAPQDQVHLFQRFYRLESDLNSPVRGSGLGLYISRRLIEAMGGKIWIESSGTPGEGSTFQIQLPMG